MKRNPNSISPILWVLAFFIAAVLALAIVSFTEDFEEGVDTQVPLPPNLYSSSQYVIGTGNRLGTYFPAGQILEKWFNDHLDKKGGSFKAFQTNGSVDNIKLLKTKEIQFGMVEARIAKEAYEKNPNLRVVWPLWLDVVQMVRPPEILCPNYVFPGKQEGFIGQRNSSTARTSTEIFEALEISGKHWRNIPTDNVVSMIGDGKIGFAMIQAGIPNRTVSDSLMFYHCGLVSFSKEQLDLIKNKVSTSIDFTIKSGYYDEKQPEISTIALPNVLVTSSETSADMVEFVTEMIITGCPKLKSRFKAFETVPSDKESILKILHETGVPLHEGTRRWLNKNSENSNNFVEDRGN